MTKIYTRTGDAGTTSLGDGNRADKDSARVSAYGELDELNSFLGLLLTHEIPPDLRKSLDEIQHLLFELGGDLCIPGRQSLNDAHIEWLEHCLDEQNDKLPPLTEFIIPGGNPAAAACHVVRTVCRRAERTMVTLARREPLSSVSLAFINRLSDFLFVAARVLARAESPLEPLWKPQCDTVVKT